MGEVLDHRPHYATGGNRDFDAASPLAISWSGWRAISSRVFKQLQRDHAGIIASGVAFNAFLALFPLIIAAVSVYGILVDPLTLQQHIDSLTAVMPQSAQQLLSTRLRELTQTSDQALGWGALLGVLLSLWAANRGTKALFQGVNIVYHEDHNRGFFRYNALTLLVTVGGLLFGGLCLLLIAGLPAVAGRLPLPGWLVTALQFAVWPLLFAMLLIALGVIYKVAPDRTRPKNKWVSVGSVSAGLIWLAGSALFSYFVANFSNYDKTYGSLAAVAVLMLWLFLSAYIVLLGAKINSEMELQTAVDTTVGEEKPMGQRKAYPADHVVG